MNDKSVVALIIENGDKPTIVVEEFCKQRLDSGHFTEVEYNCNSLHTTAEDMLTALLRADVIVIQSEWLYKDQLENFAHAFSHNAILRQKQYTFYIWDLLNDANAWWANQGIADFTHLDWFLADLRWIIANHKVISVRGDQCHRMFTRIGGSFDAVRERLGPGVY